MILFSSLTASRRDIIQLYRKTRKFTFSILTDFSSFRKIIKNFREKKFEEKFLSIQVFSKTLKKRVETKKMHEEQSDHRNQRDDATISSISMTDIHF
jgi:hypothetical protein